ncbi:UNVERIFIED_CONTAM: protein, chloroplastic [Sesamum calycinum]|uniref:Protein, chloroplastic n=1 Tax=Sesamum calycinum TaxID=2727403 RepID=A0AAW2LXI2_9LAMI
MSVELHSPFLGAPLKCTVFGRRKRGDYAYLRGVKLKPSKKGSDFLSCKCAKKHDWIFQGNKFMHFCEKNVELLWKKLGLRSGWMINSVKEPIVRSKTLVKYMTPVWEEGLFLFRCSVFCTVISGVCLLVWYGQSKAKVYIEANLLPSICTLLSDHIQRELDFGKVRRISPLSITLESCSIGPHSEEFSCGEVPTIKLRIRPFASLRRGKVVIDAVLSNPSLLVAQKKNYTWLGIPYSEGIPQRHLSTEEGIDYRTRTRRISREEAARRWERERDDAARESAEKGYVISECNCVLPDHLKESTSLPTRLGTPDPFHYMDQKVQWGDHHCMDAGAEYDLKHADLERSFGAKISPAESSMWSRIMLGSKRHRFKRKTNGRDSSMVGVASKRRLLELSASAAHLYFKGQSLGKSSNSSNGSAGFDAQNLETSPMQSSADAASLIYALTNSERDARADHQDVKVDYNVDDRKTEVTEDVLTNKVILEVENKSRTDSVSGGNLEMQSRNQMNILHDPFLFTLARITKSTNSNNKFSSEGNAVGLRGTSIGPTSKYLEGDDIVNTTARNETTRLVEEVKNAHDDTLDSQNGHASSSSSLMELEPSSSVNHLESLSPSSPQSGLSPAFKNFSEALSCLLVNPLRRLKSEIGVGVEDISTELVDEIGEENTSGIDKMIPVVLDSVHFKGGTLMLLDI